MTPCPVRPRRSRGFSLIELLVAVTIGLVITLVIFQVLSDSEGRKRTSTSANDAGQAGAYAAYVIDRSVRSAGTGYTLSWNRVGGCRLNAQLPAATGETWPRAAALPAPFTAIPQSLRLAPLVIFQGASDAGSDVLMIMSGAAGFAEAPARVAPTAITALDVQLPNTIGYRAGDLVMLTGNGECLLTQVAAAKAACAGDPAAAPNTTCAPNLPLGGAYYTATGQFTSLAALAGVADVAAFSIGNTVDNRPNFELIGVGDNSTLFRHDLLLLDGQNISQPLAEGVRQLRAVYGLDTDDDGTLDTWQNPTGAFAAATLLNGTPGSNQLLRQIVAVRVGLVMRSSLIERDIVSPTELRLFTDLPAANLVTVDLTDPAENRNQRYRAIEVTIPLRNLLMRTTS